MGLPATWPTVRSNNHNSSGRGKTPVSTGHISKIRDPYTNPNTNKKTGDT